MYNDVVYDAIQQSKETEQGKRKIKQQQQNRVEKFITSLHMRILCLFNPIYPFNGFLYLPAIVLLFSTDTQTQTHTHTTIIATTMANI